MMHDGAVIVRRGRRGFSNGVIGYHADSSLLMGFSFRGITTCYSETFGRRACRMGGIGLEHGLHNTVDIYHDAAWYRTAPPRMRTPGIEVGYLPTRR